MKVLEDSCIQIRRSFKSMNTNPRIIGQWVMMDNGLVWQWTAVKTDNIVVELRPNPAAYPKSA
jgi:hypothetical protein